MPILYVKLKFSSVFLTLISLFHMLAGLAVWDSRLPLLIQLLLSVFVVLSFIYQLYRQVLFKQPKHIIALRYQSESWYITCLDQSTILVKLHSGSYLNRFLTVLRFMNEETKKKYTLILPYDAYLKRDRIALWRLIN